MNLHHHFNCIFPFNVKSMDCFDYWYGKGHGYNKRSRKISEILEAINHIKRKQCE